MAEQLVRLCDVAPGVEEDMRYSTANNFTGAPVDGYPPHSACTLTREAAEAVGRAHDSLRALGYGGLKVFDCYRPERAVGGFVAWAERDPSRAVLFERGYVARQRSAHSRGSTVDLTVVDAAGRELDMGTQFDEFSAASHPASRAVSPEARRNRRLLADAMGAASFDGIREEWWHFTLRSEPFPGTYFDTPVLERRPQT